ncbi:hypothetical protein ACFW04_013547 [Cataglyphis niger]
MGSILRESQSGWRTYRDAILPHFQEWIGRKHGNISFRITQLLTGHGCFGTYLHRIGKVPEPYCDTAMCKMRKTLQSTHWKICKAWEENRNKLCEKLEVNLDMLTLEELIQQVLRSKGKWEALAELQIPSCFERKLLRELDRKRKPGE